ncbi:unnamed protein product, partial [Chrysoparadoxa australica]
VIRLERVVAGCVRMRRELKVTLQNIIETQEELNAQKKVVLKLEVLLEEIAKEMEEAMTTDKDEMVSSLIHEGEEMVFEIEEFKIRLKDRQNEVTYILKSA